MFWEKINRHWSVITVSLAVIIIALFFLFMPKQASEATTNFGYTADTVKAEVINISEEGTTTIGEVTQAYQIALVRVLEGEFEGQQFTIDYGKRYIRSADYDLSPNQKILIAINRLPDGLVSAYFMDFVRLNPLLIIGIIFVVICVSVSGWKGVRSLLGVALSILVIIFYIIPQIINGKNPIIISLIGSLFFLTISLYLVYGWTLKTHIALFGIFIAILITGVIAMFTVNFTHLSGLGDENAIYLMQQFSQVNIKNLLVAGIIIGSLGILDDLVIGQTSAVIELYRSNPELSFKERYARAMNIGKDHIAATVNTLVMAYLGASLALFLLFSNSNINVTYLINYSYLAEEVVRALVGTIGLFTAVPIATFVACWVMNDRNRLEKLVRVFGPLLNASEIEKPKQA